MTVQFIKATVTQEECWVYGKEKMFQEAADDGQSLKMQSLKAPLTIGVFEHDDLFDDDGNFVDTAKPYQTIVITKDTVAYSTQFLGTEPLASESVVYIEVDTDAVIMISNEPNEEPLESEDGREIKFVGIDIVLATV